MALSINADPLIIEQIQSHIQLLNKQLSTNPSNLNITELKTLLYKLKNDKVNDKNLKNKTFKCIKTALKDTCKWGSSIGSIVTAGAMIAALFENQDTCIPPEIQTVLIALAASITATLTIGNQAIDYIQKKRDTTAQLVNMKLQIAREKLQYDRELLKEEEQKKKDAKMLRLMRRTLKAVESYQTAKTPENFKAVVEKVSEMPARSHPNDLIPFSRDKWLSAIISMSENEQGIQDLLDKVQKIAREINQPSSQANAEVAAKKTDDDEKPPKRQNSGKKNVEGISSPWTEGSSSKKQKELFAKYDELWGKIEKILQCEVHHLETDGLCFHRTGRISPVEDEGYENDELITASHVSADEEDSSPRFILKGSSPDDFV